MSRIETSIPCPRCRRPFTVALDEIRPGLTRACPSCGTQIKFAGQDASKVQQAVDQLGAQLKGASIKVEVKVKARRPWWKFWGA